MYAWRVGRKDTDQVKCCKKQRAFFLSALVYPAFAIAKPPGDRPFCFVCFKARALNRLNPTG
jgi:hypothetical protein